MALAASVVVLTATACDPGEDKLVMDAATGSIDITWSTSKTDADPDADASDASVDSSADGTNDGHVHGDRWGRGDVVEREWGGDPSSGGDDASVDGSSIDGATSDGPTGPKLALPSFPSPQCHECVRRRYQPVGAVFDPTHIDWYPVGFCQLLAGQKLKDAPPFNSADQSIVCQNLLDCIARTACVPPGKGLGAVADKLGTFAQVCYCGNKSAINCFTPHNHDGACSAEMEMAYQTTDEPSLILQNLTDVSSLGGIVMNYAMMAMAPKGSGKAECLSECAPEILAISDGGVEAGP
jgi:hypothetical protein